MVCISSLTVYKMDLGGMEGAEESESGICRERRASQDTCGKSMTWRTCLFLSMAMTAMARPTTHSESSVCAAEDEPCVSECRGRCFDNGSGH